MHTDLHLCSVVVIPRQRSLGSGSLSLVGYPSARFSDVPLSHAAPVLRDPRSCPSLDAAVFLQLQIYNFKIRIIKGKKRSKKRCNNTNA